MPTLSPSTFSPPQASQYPQIYKGFNFNAFRTPRNDTMELFYTIKFIKAFIIPWKNQEAFRLGLIDANGNELKTKKDVKKQKEKDEFSSINRTAWEIKRQVQYYSGLNNSIVIKLWRLMTSRFIVKEEMIENFNQQILLWEEGGNSPYLKSGYYRILVDLLGNMASAGDIIVLNKDIPSIGNIQGQATFAIRLDDDQVIILSNGEYERLSQKDYEEIKDETNQRMRLIKAIKKSVETGILAQEEVSSLNVDVAETPLFGNKEKIKQFVRKNTRKKFLELWVNS